MFGDVADGVELWDSPLFIQCDRSNSSMVVPKTVLLNHRKQIIGKTLYYSFLVGEHLDFACIANKSKFGKKTSSMYVCQPSIMWTLTSL